MRTDAERIAELWDRRDSLGVGDTDALEVVRGVIQKLDDGSERVAEVVDGEVVVHEWLKQAILLLFRLAALEVTEVGPFEFRDRLPLKRSMTAFASSPAPAPAGARTSSRARC